MHSYMKSKFILFLFAILPIMMYAERVVPDSSLVVALDARVGNSSVKDIYGTIGLRGDYSMPRYFMMRAGIQYNTINRISAEVRPAFFHDFACGRLHGEILIHYNYHHSFDNLCAGVGVGFTMDYFWVQLGYYYRSIIGSDNIITEPYNLYYEVGVNCLPQVQAWDLMVYVSNSTLNDLERVYQPALYVDALWYPSTSWGIMLGAAYMPSGIFNISTDYYQSFINVGVRYRW